MNEGARPDPSTRPGRAVAGMFGAIAPTYDFLNHLLSLGLDTRWRKRAVKALEPMAGKRYLDLCSGTGDLALALFKRSPLSLVVGADFSRPMLLRVPDKARRRRARLPLAEADAMALPFQAGVFDGVTVAFGVRNFEDLDQGFREMARVTKPDGRLVVLEFSRPRGFFGWIYRLYFGRVLPLLGRLVSGNDHAYGYLPATVERFPGPEEVTSRLEAAGFAEVTHRPITFGVARVTVAIRRPD